MWHIYSMWKRTDYDYHCNLTWDIVGLLRFHIQPIRKMSGDYPELSVCLKAAFVKWVVYQLKLWCLIVSAIVEESRFTFRLPLKGHVIPACCRVMKTMRWRWKLQNMHNWIICVFMVASISGSMKQFCISRPDTLDDTVLMNVVLCCHPIWWNCL